MATAVTPDALPRPAHEPQRRWFRKRPPLAYPDLPLLPAQRQIRVLCLSAGLKSAKLKGTLEVVSLDGQPQYEALSYTWGARTMGATIQLGQNYFVPITDNLSRALRRLRRAGTSRRLWIDAICINQSDLPERGHQVTMMGDIYKIAWRVCIWLGDVQSIGKQQQAITVWEWSLPHLMDNNRATRAYQFRPKLARSALRLEGLVANRVSDWIIKLFIDALKRALQDNRPLWHTRAWVLQELLHAKDISWYFGSFKLHGNPAELLRAVSERRSRLDPSHGKAVPPSDPEIKNFCAGLHAMAFGAEKLSYESYFWSPSSQSMPLQKAFELVTYLECTDPRDRVYSLHSIIDENVAGRIRPDYTLPCGQVFAEATFASIAEDVSCSILESARRSDNVANLPSWAVDFSDIPKVDTFFSQVRSCRPDPGWDLAALPRVAPAISHDAHVLHLKGLVLDNIITVEHSAYGWCIDSDPINQHVAPYPMGNKDNACAPGAKLVTRYDSMVSEVPGWGLLRLSGFGYAEAGGIVTESMHPLLLRTVTRYDKPPGPGPVAGSCLLYMRQRYGIKTSSGYIGACEGKPIIGDVIALVGGVCAPMVLRRCSNDNAFTLRGFAYVYGVVNGELKYQAENGGIKIENIDLV